MTKEHGERGALLGCREREQLGDLKRRDAECARIIGKGGVDEKAFDLSYCALKDKRIGATRWERMGVLSIILRE